MLHNNLYGRGCSEQIFLKLTVVLNDYDSFKELFFYIFPNLSFSFTMLQPQCLFHFQMILCERVIIYIENYDNMAGDQ